MNYKIFDNEYFCEKINQFIILNTKKTNNILIFFVYLHQFKITNNMKKIVLLFAAAYLALSSVKMIVTVKKKKRMTHLKSVLLVLGRLLKK